jgi:hypothetical protein
MRSCLWMGLLEAAYRSSAESAETAGMVALMYSVLLTSPLCRTKDIDGILR